MRSVNLLPREYVRQRRQGGPSLQSQLLVAAPLLAAVLVGATWFFAGSGLSAKRATLASLQAGLAQIPPPKPTVRQSPAVAAQHEERVGALAGALNGRVAWDRVLRHISAVLPGDVWLTKLAATSSSSSSPTPAAPTAPAPAATTTTTDTGASTAAAPAPTAVAASQVEVDGYTYSHDAVARFLARLSVVPDLRNVQLRSSTLAKSGKRSVVEFVIVAAVRLPGSSS